MTRAIIAAAAIAVAFFQPSPADDLVKAVVTVRHPSGFEIHATLTRTPRGAAKPDVRQLLILGRRDPHRAILLYQQVWPEERGGRALVLEDAGDHRLGGFTYRMGAATTLTSAMGADPFFDSDLTLEDMAEDFWYWPMRTVVGREAVGEHQCTIVELRPAASTSTRYSRVKAWLSPELATGLRAQLFDKDGRLAKQIGLYRVLKLEDRWVPALITVEPADGHSRTVIEGVKYDAEPQLRAADFTVAAVRASARLHGGR